MRTALLIAVLTLPALAQSQPVPLEYQDLYAQLQSKLTEFDATISRQWNGTRPPVDFSAELFTANANRGLLLLTAGTATSELEIARLQALGAKTVTVAIGFPILYQPFDPLHYQGYLSFYKQLAANIHAAGMKMVVETGVVFPSLDAAAFYPTLPDLLYVNGRAQQILTIAREIQPDYLVIAEEPDTEAEITGKSFIATVPGFSFMVDTFLSQLNSAGFTGTNVGAGVGTWINNAPGYINTLAAKSRLNFIDLHVYPINLTFLNDTIALIDLAQKPPGKPVTMSEAWLEKRRDTEYSSVGVASNDFIFARDPFSFWAPLDQQFLTAFAKLARWKQLKVFSPFWSGYFHAYLNYNSAYDSIAPDQILHDASVVESTAIQQYTSTGLAYQSLVTNPASSPAAVSAASFAPGPVAPDSMVSIFGVALAPSTVTGPIPLLNALAGTTVTFTDSAGASSRAPLYFVSPGQVNAVVPAGLKPGPATFQVSGATGSVTISAVAPALFSANANGQGAAAAIVVRTGSPPDYAFQCGAAPGSCVPKPIDLGDSTGQVFLELFGTGIRGRNALTDVTVSVGGVPITPQYAGAQPQYPGMDQVNIQLPPALAGRGAVTIDLSVAGVHANPVAINVK
jgi:uncharacterized protein (TIGR03437 family)